MNTRHFTASGSDDLASLQDPVITASAGRSSPARPAELRAASATAISPLSGVPPLRLSSAISKGAAAPASIHLPHDASHKLSRAADGTVAAADGARAEAHSTAHTEGGQQWDGSYPVQGGQARIRAKVVITAAGAKAAAADIAGRARIAVNCNAADGNPSVVQVCTGATACVGDMCINAVVTPPVALYPITCAGSAAIACN